MSGRCLRGNRSRNGEKPIECIVNMPVQQFKLGDIIWCRINGSTWWPVQVVDEKCVASKPKKKKKDQILVRLYGTFEHMYVEPVNCVSKNEKIYGLENCSSREIFAKALEEDLSHMKSGGQSETRVSESNESVKEKDEAPRGKGERKGKLKRTMVEENSRLVDSSDISNAAKQAKIVIKGPRRRTRIETFKVRNDKKIGTEAAVVETLNGNNGDSPISSLNKKDLRISGQNSSEKLISNCHFGAFESNCDWNSDAYKNVQIENSDAKYIRRLVTKIVKEVAADDARNESLKDIGMESHLESTEYIETLRKESYKIRNGKRCIPRRMKKQDMDLLVTGVSDDTPDKITGLSHVRNTNGGDHVNNLREQGFVSDNDERKKDAEIDVFESMAVLGINDANPCQSTILNVCVTVMGEVKCSEIEVAINGDQKCKVVKDVSREQMDRTGAAKCSIQEENEELSPRRTRIMQNLGLAAPSGSPYRRNGLNRSLRGISHPPPANID